MQYRTKIKLKNMIMAVLVASAAIVIPAWLYNKWIEAFFFFFCHWFIREQFRYQYHCATHRQCRIVTFIIFTVCIILVIPMAVSFFSVVYLCYFIGYLGCTKKKLNNAEVKLNRLTVVARPFDCEACTEEELLRRCKEKHLSQDNTNLAVEFFVLKTKQSKIADKLCINEKSVQVRKKKIKNKIK